MRLPSTQTIGPPPTELHAPTVRAVVDFLADRQRQLDINGAGADAKLAAYTNALHELCPSQLRGGTAQWIAHPGVRNID